MRPLIPALAATLTLAACTSTPPPPPPPPPPPARPAPPQALSPIHQNLAPHKQLWHVRAGLNVAALSCAQKVGPAIVTDYNAFLKAKQALLAEAYAQLSADYRARGGNWQRMLDADMTKLYNHFASPTAQGPFCEAAAAEVKRAIAAAPDGDWADALRRLDSPFTNPPQYAARSAPPAAPIGARGLLAMPVSEPRPVPAGWRIQLGAFNGKPAAQTVWSEVKGRSPELGQLTPHFEPVPGKSLVRLQVKGVQSREDAIRLCAHAAAAGFDCIPVRET
ncbi:MAG: SPOR domain-containing protein [Sandaracinobacter sp.]